MYANVSDNLLPPLLGYKIVEVASYFEILVPVLSVYTASLTIFTEVWYAYQSSTQSDKYEMSHRYSYFS
jgi:hypothetical protein